MQRVKNTKKTRTHTHTPEQTRTHSVNLLQTAEINVAKGRQKETRQQEKENELGLQMNIKCRTKKAACSRNALTRGGGGIGGERIVNKMSVAFTVARRQFPSFLLPSPPQPFSLLALHLKQLSLRCSQASVIYPSPHSATPFTFPSLPLSLSLLLLPSRFLATCNLFVMAPNDDECDLVWLRNSQLELELRLGMLPLALSLSPPLPAPVPRQLLQLPSDCLGQG